MRDVVIYPNMVVPLFVGRDLSIKSLDDAMNNHEKNIVLVTQKSAQVDDPDLILFKSWYCRKHSSITQTS